MTNDSAPKPLNEQSVKIDDKLITDTMELISFGEAEIEKARNQAILLVLGATGCGKSTTINYLAGCEMTEETEPQLGVTRIGCKNPVCEIGNGSISKTLYPSIAPFLDATAQRGNFKLCDTAGFLDNRGTVYELCSAFTLREVFVQSAEIRGIVAVIPSEDIDPGSRGIGLIDLFRQLQVSLIQPANYIGSLTFFVTKNQTRSRQQVINCLSSIYQQLDREEISDVEWLFQEMLKNGGENVHLCNPLDAEAREHLLQVLTNLKSVRDKNHSYHLPLSALTSLTLTAILGRIKEEIMDDALGLWKHWTSYMENRLDDEKQAFVENCLAAIRAVEQFSAKDKAVLSELLDILRPGASSGFCEHEFLAHWQRIFARNHIFQALYTLSESGQEILFLSDILLKNIQVNIRKLRQKACDKQGNILIEELKEYCSCYEIQSWISDDAVHNSFTRLVNRKISTQDFEPLFSHLPANLQDKCRTCLNGILDCGKETLTKLYRVVQDYLANPFTIISQNEHSFSQLIIISNGKNYAMSAAVHMLANRAIPQQDILFLARDTIFMDVDLSAKKFGGKNVGIYCRKLIMMKEAKINVSGKSGDRLVPGLTPAPGESGGHSGNICLFIREQFVGNYNLNLVLNGGNGFKGGDGRDGTKGADGKDGIDATANFPNKYIFLTTYNLNKGIPGESGKNGTDGTNAGQGGYGGKGGGVELVINNRCYNFRSGVKELPIEDSQAKIVITMREGLQGEDGRPGRGGKGGRGGLYPLDCVRAYHMLLHEKIIYEENIQEVYMGMEYPYTDVLLGKTLEPYGERYVNNVLRKFYIDGLNGRDGNLVKNAIVPPAPAPEIRCETVLKSAAKYLGVTV